MRQLSRSIRLSVATTVALAAAGVAALAGPSAPAAAQTVPSHVAIYVAGVGTACAPAGANGLSLLNSRYNVVVGQPGRPTVGMVLFINDVGSNSNKPDYWSYWHWSGGQWVYANTGPSGYTPAPGTADGWAFGHYKSTDPSPLPDANYGSLCGAQDPTLTPKPPTTTRSTPGAPSTTARQQPPVPGGGAASTPVGNAASTPEPTGQPVRTAADKTATAPTGTKAGTSPNSTVIAGQGPVAGSAPALVALDMAPPKPKPSSQSGIPSWGTALALLLVGVLGGVAFWRTKVLRRDTQ